MRHWPVTAAFVFLVLGCAAERGAVAGKAELTNAHAFGAAGEGRAPGVVYEGLGVGRLVVGMRLAEVVELLGKPEGQKYGLFYRNRLHVEVWPQDGQVAQIRFVAGFPFHLASGVSLQSKLEDVFQAYGSPVRTVSVEDIHRWTGDRILYESDKAQKITYAKQGVLFLFDRSSGQMSEFVVFASRP